MAILSAVIQLRRDNDYNFEKIKDTFIPANGEVVLVDTAKDGLRAKVGNGYTPYEGLPFTDADIRNTVQQGYYDNGTFYRNADKSAVSPGMVNKLYIDIPSQKLYYYNGTSYIIVNDNMPNASAYTAGIMKLYNTTGQNTDGAMTQKAVTDELDLRYKATIDSDDELLIFSI